MQDLSRHMWTVAVIALAVASLVPFFAVTAVLGLDSPRVPDAVAVLAISVACYATFFALTTAEGRATAARTGGQP